ESRALLRRSVRPPRPSPALRQPGGIPPAHAALAQAGGPRPPRRLPLQPGRLGVLEPHRRLHRLSHGRLLGRLRLAGNAPRPPPLPARLGGLFPRPQRLFVGPLPLLPARPARLAGTSPPARGGRAAPPAAAVRLPPRVGRPPPLPGPHRPLPPRLLLLLP